MKIKSYLKFISFFLFPVLAYAQDPQMVRGVVLEETNKGNFVPLVGTSVFWLGTSEGTVTDTSGVFSLALSSYIATGFSEPKLVINYLGYQGDTIGVNSSNASKLRVILKEDKSQSLKEVEVTGRRQTSYMNALSPLNTTTMSEKELFKAACCNLSESFETNPSVDVNFADAVSGAKQIQVLGLSGIYTQLTNENLPGTRGISASYGLSYIPGPWIESIQVTKGAGSVANGYESMAGQINVELKKTDITPQNGERIYFNSYVNDWGRLEGNLNWTQKISSKWATTTLLHANTQLMMIDRNNDGFLDIPLGTQFNGINRWKYDNGKGFLFQAGVKALKDERTGGQMHFNKDTDKLNTSHYGLGLGTQRLESFIKAGYVFPEKKYKSVGLMVSGLYHQQNNFFGLSTYDAKQKSLYFNLIYQSIINNTNHKFRLGLSQVIDNYDERYIARGLSNATNQNFGRTEIVPGAFVEYTWTIAPTLTTIGGLRVDYHNMFGVFVTPRLHGKWDITQKTHLRFSAGRGQRTASILAENSSVFASSRNLIITPSNTGFRGRAYGLSPEIAWNYGLSLHQDFKLNYKAGAIVVDFYRTDFQNQVVVDFDKNPREINFYNLQGRSYSNSFQTEINYELIKRFEVRLAYRWYDVKTTYSGQLLPRPLLASHRAFINLDYATKNKWKFDYTITWNGSKRIPNTASNPEQYRQPTQSPSYFVMNAQISKSFGKPTKHWFDVYVGMENITDTRQKSLIVAADQPFSPFFDTSLVWGPIVGRMMYMGVRYKLK